MVTPLNSGGMAYEQLGWRYETPIVGLFLVIEDYMQLLRRLRSYCEGPLELVSESRHEEINAWREAIQKPYPIGVLGGDVEVNSCITVIATKLRRNGSDGPGAFAGTTCWSRCAGTTVRAWKVFCANSTIFPTPGK